MPEKSARNPSRDSHHNLTRLSTIKVPSRRPINAHDVSISATRNWIAGDFTGLRQIANELYEFAGASNDEVSQAAGHVERLIGDSGDWSGSTSDAFRWSFGGDVMLVNDLAQVALAIGQVIENLANNLASLEASLDNILSPRLASGDFVLARGQDDTIFIAVAKRLDGQTVFARNTGPIARTAVNARKCYIAAQRKAKKIRQETITQLAVLCEPVNKNLGIYTSPDGEQREREGRDDGPLRHDQITNDQNAVNALQKQFKAAMSGGSSGVGLKDVKQALTEVGKFGGDVHTIGGVVDDIKAMQHANALDQAGKAGNIAQQVSGVVRDLLVFLAAEPIK
jgi:hypothetical protein